jgi:hypothetical protein
MSTTPTRETTAPMMPVALSGSTPKPAAMSIPHTGAVAMFNAALEALVMLVPSLGVTL